MVIRPLFTAFHNNTIIERWIDKTSNPYGLWIQGWLNDNKMSDCLRGWFADEGISDQGFTSEEVSRMRIAARSTAALFKPMALFCARNWIGPDVNDWNPELYVWFLHVYLGLVSKLCSCLLILSVVLRVHGLQECLDNPLKQ